MRIVIFVTGLVFAAGFLALRWVGPPNPQSDRTIALCVAVCLTISLATFRNWLGEFARRLLGTGVCLVYAAYFVRVVREGHFPWGPIGGLLLYGVPGATYAIFGPRWGDVFRSIFIEDWEGREFAAQMTAARGLGRVDCRWREFRRPEKARASIVTRLSERVGANAEAVSLPRAREAAVEFLTFSREDGHPCMSQNRAAAFVDSFIESVRLDDPCADARVAVGEGQAGIALVAGRRMGMLVVDEWRYDDDDEDDYEQSVEPSGERPSPEDKL